MGWRWSGEGLEEWAEGLEEGEEGEVDAVDGEAHYIVVTADNLLDAYIADILLHAVRSGLVKGAVPVYIVIYLLLRKHSEGDVRAINKGFLADGMG